MQKNIPTTTSLGRNWGSATGICICMLQLAASDDVRKRAHAARSRSVLNQAMAFLDSSRERLIPAEFLKVISRPKLTYWRTLHGKARGCLGGGGIVGWNAVLQPYHSSGLALFSRCAIPPLLFTPWYYYSYYIFNRSDVRFQCKVLSIRAEPAMPICLAKCLNDSLDRSLEVSGAYAHWLGCSAPFPVRNSTNLNAVR